MFAAGPIGIEIMVKGSGYMPMHKEGTARLAKFYAEHPNFKTSVEQVPFIFTWHAFPGQNTLKIIDVIKDNLQATVAKQAMARKVARCHFLASIAGPDHYAPTANL
jgi:multiple sugar transport system substrate-binding protein